MRAIIGKLLLPCSILLAVSCGPASKTAVKLRGSEGLGRKVQARSEGVRLASADSLAVSRRILLEETRELKETALEMVPAARVSLTIRAQDLVNLPEGAKYGASEGRATVEVQRVGDTYVAISRCDSIARQCVRYESAIRRQEASIDSLNSVISDLRSKYTQMALEAHSNRTASTVVEAGTKSPWDKRWKLFAFGAIIGMAALAGGQILWKRNKIGHYLRKLITNLFK